MSVLSSQPPLCPDDENPSKWILDRIFVVNLGDILNPQQCQDLQSSICGLNFIYGHIGGQGTNSPQRGVAVVGDRLLSPGSEPITHTHWTASQNASQITTTTQTQPLPDGIFPLIDPLIKLTRKHFPDAPISSATYSLGVANEYRPDYKDNISPHTDDQKWYASPPVFASITYYPDGQPEIPNACFRFKVYDESVKKWVFVHLPNNSMCLMRADVKHQVLAPFVKYKGMFKRRINMTLRNLVPPETNPLGFAMAMANHYRYYGRPIKIKLPADSVIENHLPLLRRYRELSTQVGTSDIFSIVKSNLTSSQRRQLHLKFREKLRQLYQERKLDQVDIDHILSKSNVVIETTHRAISWLQGNGEITDFDPIETHVDLSSYRDDTEQNRRPIKEGDFVIIGNSDMESQLFLIKSAPTHSSYEIRIHPLDCPDRESVIIPHNRKWCLKGAENIPFTFEWKSCNHNLQ